MPYTTQLAELEVLGWILAGDRLSRADIFALGHGGLLEDAPERPTPRTRLNNAS